MENKEKFKKLLKDEEFVTKLLDMQTREEVQEEFKRQGIDVSLEEVGELGDIINYLIKEEKTQLSEEDLKNISGGGYTHGVGEFLAGSNDEGDIKITEKAIREGRARKWGEIEIVALTAIIAIPVGIAVTKFATWGIDKLIKKIDEKTDKKK